MNKLISSIAFLLFQLHTVQGIVDFFPYFFCLHGDSFVETPYGPKLISQVQKGDLVATQAVEDGSEREFVMVVDSIEYHGSFDFVTFEFEDGASLNVTTNHIVALENAHGEPVIKPAGEVEAGARMYRRKNGAMVADQVDSATAISFPKKYAIATATASILVGHEGEQIFTTTICDRGAETLPRSLPKALDIWVKSHKAQGLF